MGKMMIIKFLEITKQPFYSIKADCAALSSANGKLVKLFEACLPSGKTRENFHLLSSATKLFLFNFF